MKDTDVQAQNTNSKTQSVKWNSVESGRGSNSSAGRVVMAMAASTRVG